MNNITQLARIQRGTWGPVCQLYEDKSLALRARDLIFFTTDLQKVNYYPTIHYLSSSICIS